MSQLHVRERVRAASGRLKSLERADRVARALITLGGVGIVASVVGILVFVLAEAWPIFASPDGAPLGQVTLQAPAPAAPGVVAPAPSVAGVPEVLATGVDEYQRYVYQLRRDGRVLLFRLDDGTFARELASPAILREAPLTAGSRSPQGDYVAAATADGRVALMQLTFRPVYEQQRRSDVAVELVDHGVAVVDPGGRPVRTVAYRQDDGGKVVAAALGGDEIALWQDRGEGERLVTLRAHGEPVTRLALGGTGQLAAGTEAGNVLHWDLGSEPARLTSISPIGPAPVTALAWILGDTTFVAGNRNGQLQAWFAVRLDDDDPPTMVRAHTYVPQGAPVAAIGISTRDKTFAAAGTDGSVSLHYTTNERLLLRFEGGIEPASVTITPRNDGLLVANGEGVLAVYGLDVPHPEITWRTLFGELWYEGYPTPAHVWQSTGATNEFETKFSLVPLVFGTLKGTFYALLFAVPLSLLGALYTSQFVHPDIRGRIKPTLEIMAALPSVVIGFVAGLWLASVVERWIVPVLLMMVLLPAFGTAGVLVWKRLPAAVLKRLKPGAELLLIVPLLILAGQVAVLIGPPIEGAFFAGDFKLWLSTALGVTYDQRNSLVVGLAMGFAVIPIIFTIADDAFSSVPASLTAGSLALGASRWQTAVRVVLPTASPGLFSAVMIGFGRAVGETMIVLMATGNTPVLDWSMFNGMRTLSANIAVEIPEAPHGGTLYRVLFFSAALLFMITFAVNTVAEVVRQRLRERYRTL